MKLDDKYALAPWPRWRFINNWRPLPDFDAYVFCLFSAWWGSQFVGVMIFNCAIEYNRKANIKL